MRLGNEQKQVTPETRKDYLITSPLSLQVDWSGWECSAEAGILKCGAQTCRLIFQVQLEASIGASKSASWGSQALQLAVPGLLLLGDALGAMHSGQLLRRSTDQPADATVHAERARTLDVKSSPTAESLGSSAIVKVWFHRFPGF